MIKQNISKLNEVFFFLSYKLDITYWKGPKSKNRLGRENGSLHLLFLDIRTLCSSVVAYLYKDVNDANNNNNIHLA